MTTSTDKNAVCFYNNGTFDKRAFTMLGLSAKAGDNPIGFFGTGFKYAIAMLLRNGFEVSIADCYTVYTFYTAPSSFRDKEYTAIFCRWNNGDDEMELPFTTHLGANWKLWQAYRELFTNALDEGGGVCLGWDDAGPSAGDVCVYVTGPRINEFANIYHNHAKYFLDQPDLARGKRMRAVAKKADSDNVVYYKTMYTGTKLDKNTYFTYDYVKTTELTEDRTLADTWYIRTHIGELWVHDMSYDMLIEHLPKVAVSEFFEYNLEVGYDKPSDAFYKACAYLNKQHMPMPMWARELFTKSLPFDKQIEGYKPTRYQRTQVMKAVAILHHHGHVVDAEKLVFCVSLPNDVLGYYCDGIMYLSKQCFELGFEKLLGTIYEEYLHMHDHVSDMTRKMQNILVDKVAVLMLEVYEMEDVA